jgi:hypothetical protein
MSTTPHEAQHTLPTTEQDAEYTITVDQCDWSTTSSLSCSITSCRIKRTRKTMDLSSFYQCDLESSKKRRRRGASYTIVEIHSLLHLMKRVLPKCGDEWELIRMVHCRIFPDNDRTVSSLKKKFKDLCREAPSDNQQQQLDERFRAKPAFSEREAEKAREVQELISQKPPGFQLVLSNSREDEQVSPNSLPNFKVKVPDPLQSSVAPTEPEPEPVVPKFIQIPDSPSTNAERQNQHQPEDDEMSELDLDDHENDDFGEMEPSVIGNPLPLRNPLLLRNPLHPIPTPQEITTHRGMMVSPCADITLDRKLHANIIEPTQYCG